jgi:hypothetical protein
MNKSLHSTSSSSSTFFFFLGFILVSCKEIARVFQESSVEGHLAYLHSAAALSNTAGTAPV